MQARGPLARCDPAGPVRVLNQMWESRRGPAKSDLLETAARMANLDPMIADAHRKRMHAAGMPEIAIRSFLRTLRFVREGGETMIHESSIDPVDALPHADGLADFEGLGREAARHAVVIKLNGGLGTSMGLHGPKSLLPVRSGLTFLDLIARQVLWLRSRESVELPLMLMNSFRTREPSLEALAQYPELATSLPLDFLQHRVPRINIEDGMPVEWPSAPELEWCPPGHGDLYAALQSSGQLGRLREQGIRYAFVSNADNLGGALDLSILGWFAAREIPFAMEVAERTVADKKGGHLARRGSQFILRESAQCPAEDLLSFQDIERHHYFNTNNLWIDLDALAERIDASPDGIPLPVIQNMKTVEPDVDDGPRCLQLETAMGAAIECFEGAEAICVSRDRFAPVKTTNDLLGLWSDAFELTDDARLVAAHPELQQKLEIDLDPRFYRNVEQLQDRFPDGAPSLVKCSRLSIRGDHRFGAGVSALGDVQLVNESAGQIEISAGSVLEERR